ncbi:MAG: hypothetical protein M1561_03345 [Gammaproteobacteria bacterium]|nr:hypothetical protein [Gammaproteobacteria bacterium]
MTPANAKLSIERIKHALDLKDEENRIETLAQLLQKNQITPEQLCAACKEADIKTPGSCINTIGLRFARGDDDDDDRGIKKNTVIAFKLFKLAADEFRHVGAYGNCAVYYFFGSAPDGENLSAAKKYCESAIQGGANYRHILLANILYKKKEYCRAFESLSKLNAEGLTEERKKKAEELRKKCFAKLIQRPFDVKDYSSMIDNSDSVLPYLSEKEKEQDNKLRRRCFLPKLETLFAKAAEHEEDGELAEGKEAKEAVESKSNEVKVYAREAKASAIEGFAGWHRISRFLDGFEEGYKKEKESKKNKLRDKKNQLAVIEAKLEVLKKYSGSIGKTQAENKNAEISKMRKETVSLNHELDELEAEIKSMEADLEFLERYYNSNEHTLRRQFQTELRFFNPKRTKKYAVFDLSRKLERMRLSFTPLVEALELKNELPARQMITAERATMQASKELLELSDKYISGIGWVRNPSATQVSRSGYQYFYTQYEKLRLGGTEFCYRQQVNPHPNHLGNYYMSGLKKFTDGGILRDINAITRSTERLPHKKNEQAVARLMLRFSHKGKPVTLNDLKKLEGSANLSEANVSTLNRILFNCSVKECSRRMFPVDSPHMLPFATAQARALILIREGYLSMSEVFGADASYGVFTGTDIGREPSAVRAKIIRINTLYNRHMLDKKTDENTFANLLQFYKKYPDAKVVPTRQELHRELQEVYGGESDTDGEGYDSDSEAKKLKNEYRGFRVLV